MRECRVQVRLPASRLAHYPVGVAASKKSNRSTSKRQSYTGAAFFDLDRTLLAGASGPVFSEALRTVGVMAGNRNPAEPVLFKIFDVFGENYPTMFFTRQGVRFTKGWSRALVAEAAEWAAPRLVDRVLPYAHVEFAEHRSAVLRSGGRSVRRAAARQGDGSGETHEGEEFAIHDLAAVFC